MKILAVDSTSSTAAAAVTHGNELIGSFTMHGMLKHSETLLPMIDSLLGTADLTLGDIDMFACSAGPGSFTGVRIGVSLIKGLAFGTGKPCVGVSTLEALAYNFYPANFCFDNLNNENQNQANTELPRTVLHDSIICPVMDARRSQLYNALFLGNKRMTADRLISAQALAAELKAHGRRVYFTGDGYDIALSLISLPGVCATPLLLRNQSAYAVAMCALDQYRKNPGAYSDKNLSPVYLRASQAERERAAALKIDGK